MAKRRRSIAFFELLDDIVLSVFVHTGHVWEFEFSTLSIIYMKSSEGIL